MNKDYISGHIYQPEVRSAYEASRAEDSSRQVKPAPLEPGPEKRFYFQYDCGEAGKATVIVTNQVKGWPGRWQAQKVKSAKLSVMISPNLPPRERALDAITELREYAARHGWKVAEE
jgi:hypothetical protein